LHVSIDRLESWTDNLGVGHDRRYFFGGCIDSDTYIFPTGHPFFQDMDNAEFRGNSKLGMNFSRGELSEE
jgi:hypothetical protein